MSDWTLKELKMRFNESCETVQALEDQLANKQEQCDQLAHEVLALESHLRLLASAVLEAHYSVCDFCPLRTSMVDCKEVAKNIESMYCCQCEACKVAREYTNGLV